MAINFVDAGDLSAAITSPLSVELPTHSEGDFLMLVVADRTGDQDFSAITVPAGWNGPIVSTRYVANHEGFRVYWKIAGASETDPISVSHSGNVSVGWSAFIAAYSGVHETDPLDSGLRWNGLNGQNVTEGTPPDTRTSTDGAMAILLAMTSDDNALALKSGDEEGFTQRVSYDTLVGDDHSVFMADRDVATAGDVTAPTVEQTINSGDVFQAIGIMSLRPAGSTPVGPRMVYSRAGRPGSDSTTPLSLPLGFDVQEDDLILVSVGTRATSTPTVSVSGYTLEEGVTITNPPGGFLFYKVADGSETAVEVTVNPGGNFGWVAGVQIWREVDPDTPFDVASVPSSQVDSGTFTPASITPVTAEAAVIAFAFLMAAPSTPEISVFQGFQNLQTDTLWSTVAGFRASAYSADRRVATPGSVTAPTFDRNDAVATHEWAGITAALRPASTPPPAAPTNPAATALSASSIRITWDDVADETGYRVERSPDGSGSWVDVSGNLAADTVQYDDSGLAASTQYFYRIFAFNAGGDSPASTTVNATTQAGGGGGGNRMGGDRAIRKPPR